MGILHIKRKFILLMEKGDFGSIMFKCMWLAKNIVHNIQHSMLTDINSGFLI